MDDFFDCYRGMHEEQTWYPPAVNMLQEVLNNPTIVVSRHVPVLRPACRFFGGADICLFLLSLLSRTLCLISDPRPFIPISLDHSDTTSKFNEMF
jgi:hypothetical protein